jgi:GNAT superfamily N-acetyltransferase
MQYLPTPFRGTAGQRLLSAYYRTVAQARGAIGYVAEDRGRVLGYICGVWEPDILRTHLLKTQWPALALWGTASVLRQPRLMASFVQRFNQPAAQRIETPPASGYELRPIVVDRAARGTGLAARLVERLIQDARSRGFAVMHLFVETDNQPARAFYQKMGFAAAGHPQPSGDLVIRLEHLLQDAE